MHGTIEDYKDIIEEYLSGKIDFKNFTELFNKKYNSFNQKKPITIDLINKQLITNK